MQGAKERRLRRMSNTPQGGAIEGNAADDALLVDQAYHVALFCRLHGLYLPVFNHNGNSNMVPRDAKPSLVCKYLSPSKKNNSSI